MIVFSVIELIDDDRIESSPPADDEDAARTARLNLALATAKDAVQALGGDLQLKRVRAGRTLIAQIHLDQPHESQSESLT
jgi:hypothetical protein